MGSPFLNSVRRAILTLHYSIRTEQARLSWIRQYILFHSKPEGNRWYICAARRGTETPARRN
jgi:hypothetical protein